MAFSTNCTNKGCGKIQNPYLDPKTNKIYCSLCDKEIINISPFTKNQMKFSKQFKEKKTISFSIKCENCEKEDRPKLLKDDVVCSSCSKPLDKLTPVFKEMLKIQLKQINKDD